MIYIADLRRNNLIKIGITAERRERARTAELRRQLNEPRLRIVATEFVPPGWGTDREWEQSLLSNVRARSERLQLAAVGHCSKEVLQATVDEALAEMRLLLRQTEVDPQLSALELDDTREDWRFYYFVRRAYPESDPSSRHWDDLITRQAFLYDLRGEPITRWERLSLGYSLHEIEEIYKSADSHR
jgi:hypothetical protein